MRQGSKLERTPGAARGMLLAATVAVALGVSPLGAQNACIKTIGSSPTLNGVVAGSTSSAGCAVDVVWQGVQPVGLWSGGAPSGGMSPGGYLFFAYRNPAGPNNDRLWVGIDIAGDDNLTDWDVIYLLFDADKSGSWNAGDFYIKVPASSSSTLINSGAQCSQPCGAKEYWEHNGATWQQIAGPEASINANVAYDYEVATDPEQHIWNVEIDMPVALVTGSGTRFNLNTAAAPFFAMGAYVFADRNHVEAPNPQEGTVLRWPQSMVERTITQQNLFGLPASQATQLGGVSLSNTCFDVNFAVADPWRINGQVANAYDNRIIRNGVNNFRVRFKYQGPDTIGAGTLSNPGQVRLSLTPFNASFWVPGNEFTKTKTVNVTPTPAAFPGEYYADLSWNFGAAAESWSAFESAHGTVEFLCAHLELVGFARDDNTSNNSKYVNHNEFTTSEYTHDLTILPENIPGLRAGESTMLRLRMESLNDPQSRSAGAGALGWLRPLGTPPATVALLLAALAGFAIVLGGRPRRGVVRSGYALAGSAILLAGCAQLRQLLPRAERWQIENAERVGLRPLEGNPGWYEMPIRQGEVKRLRLRFAGRPLPYRTIQRRMVPADSAGQLNRMRFAVTPGQVVTVLAFGEVDLDGPSGPLPRNSATGFTIPSTQTTLRAAAAEGGLLLRDGYYRAAQHAGALIGTFDGWRHAFVVGRAASVVVPENSRELQLAVNGALRGARMIDGFFEVSVIETPPLRAPTHALNAGDATYSIPPSIDPWRVLTSLNVYTYRIQEDRNLSGALVGRTLVPAGAAHYSIYAAH